MTEFSYTPPDKDEEARQLVEREQECKDFCDEMLRATMDAVIVEDDMEEEAGQ